MYNKLYEQSSFTYVQAFNPDDCVQIHKQFSVLYYLYVFENELFQQASAAKDLYGHNCPQATLVFHTFVTS